MISNRSSAPSQNFVVSNIHLRGVAYSATVETNLVTLEIYETLDGLSSGIVFITDSNGISDLLSITGLEAIDIEFASGVGGEYANVYSKTFRVTGATRLKSNTGRVETLAVKFTNNLLSLNELNKRPYTFKATSISNMVKTIIDDFGDEAPEYNIEDTLFSRDYTTHIAKPIDVINELTNYTNSSTSGGCKYMFYEDRNAVNFVSLGTLRQADYKYIIRSGLRDGSDKFSAGVGNVIQPIRIEVTEQTNMHDITSGIYGARTYSHSLVNKRIEVKDLRQSDYISNIGILNDVGHLQVANEVLADEIPFAEQPLNNIQLVPGDGFYKDDTKHRMGSVHSISAMEGSYLNAKRLTIEIPGNTNLTVGDNIYLEYASVSEGQLSAMTSGKWLIYDLMHKLNTDTFTTTLEVVSDSSVNVASSGRSK